MYSNYFTEIIPYAGYDIKQIAWHECMACGNGHIGVLTSGAPKNDSFIFQNTEFVMPSDEPRCVPAEVTDTQPPFILREKLRRTCRPVWSVVCKAEDAGA